MAKKTYTAEELKAINELLIEQAKRQSEVSNSLEDYLKGLEKAKKMNQTINENKKIEEKLLEEARQARKKGDIESFHLAALKLKLLKKETLELENQLAVLGASLKQVNKTNLIMSKMGASALKGVAKLPGLFQSSYGKLKGYGLFEMDKAIKTSALQMGLLGKESKSYQEIIKNVAIDTNNIGIGVEKLSEMQAMYADNLGRNVTLTKDGLKAMAGIASATQLGSEGTARMAADMENQGYSAEATAKFVEDTLNDSHKMGLNASKVIKNITSNMKMLNKYNFKGGVKGLAKMAETTAKLGVDMGFATGMADKLFDIEGAVDMSAQLQVMGGAWAQLADPFKLMYMARNDMAGLTEALGKAAESAAHFNKEGTDFEISALEMHRLRKIADETGASYEELATAGKNAAKFTKIKSQINFDLGTGKEAEAMKEFITSKGLFENGKAYIEVDGEKKFLNQLGAAGKDLIKQQVLEKKTLEERAKASQTFDDKLTNLINMVKTNMLPIIDGIESVLGPLVDGLLKSNDFKNNMKKLGSEIAGFVKFGAEIVKTVAKWALALGPTGTLATILGAKFLFNAASWISNGALLAQGFNAGMAGKSVLSSLGSSLTGGLGSTGKMLGGGVGRGALAAGGLGIAGAGIGALTDANTDPGSAMNVLGNAAADAMTGAAIGSFLGPIGMAVGGVIGGLYGGIKAYNSKPDTSSSIDSVNDGTSSPYMPAGLIKDPNFLKNNKVKHQGKITRIDDNDNFITWKKNGAFENGFNNESKSNNSSSNQTMKVEHSDIKISGDITVSTPGGNSVSLDIMNNEIFKQELAYQLTKRMNTVSAGGQYPA